MKKFLFALLTTLLVNAMPLQAAYAQADDGAQCSLTYKDAMTDKLRADVEANKGNIVELDAIRAEAFQSRVEDLVGQPAPFKSDKIVLITQTDEEGANVVVAFFVNNCMKAAMVLPSAVIGVLLSPLEKKPGERVD